MRELSEETFDKDKPKNKKQKEAKSSIIICNNLNTLQIETLNIKRNHMILHFF